MLAGVAMCESIDSNLNSCPTGSVPKRVDPIAIDLGHAHRHVASVSYGIRSSRAATTVCAGPNVPDERRAAHASEMALYPSRVRSIRLLCEGQSVRRSPRSKRSHSSNPEGDLQKLTDYYEGY